MTLPDLLSALEREAADELAAAERAAEREAAAIRAAARADAERLFAEAVCTAEAQAHHEAARTVAAARAAVARELRATREAALLEVRATAVEALDAVRHGPDGEAVLAASLSAALSRVPAARTVRADPRDADRLRALVADGGLTVVADLRTCGGVVVQGGGRFADSTVESRLSGAWPALRGQLAARWEQGA